MPCGPAGSPARAANSTGEFSLRGRETGSCCCSRAPRPGLDGQGSPLARVSGRAARGLDADGAVRVALPRGAGGTFPVGPDAGAARVVPGLVGGSAPFAGELRREGEPHGAPVVDVVSALDVPLRVVENSPVQPPVQGVHHAGHAAPARKSPTGTPRASASLCSSVTSKAISPRIRRDTACCDRPNTSTTKRWGLRCLASAARTSAATRSAGVAGVMGIGYPLSG